ncbi:MAG: amidohydrolase [SAR202 cluster bacterium]|nr:amidohydrolase [SAR202 cluster bacterium]
MRIVDTHCHAGHNWFEPVETLLFEMNSNGVTEGVLIQHGGTYDNDYLFECTERFPGRFKVAVLIDPDDPDQPGTLAKLARRGAAGIRLYPPMRVSGRDPLALWKKAGDLGVVVSCMGTTEQFASDEFHALVKACASTTIVVEHLAGAKPTTMPDDALFLKALKLAELPNTCVKIPGLGEFTPRPPRLAPALKFGKVQPLIELVYKAWGPKRMMWGSDFPPVAGREGYRNALEGVRSHPALVRPGDVEWVLGKTAAAVWGFGDK